MFETVSRDGTRIAYRVSGDGPPIVLLNGAFRDHTIFDQLTPELAPRLTTYVYDRRGRGRSGDASRYSPEREIEDLAALIDRAGGRAVVFAGSCGANLALDAAVAGVAITRLVLHEPFYRVDGFAMPPEGFLTTLRGLLAEGRRDEAAEFFLSDLLELGQDVIDAWRTGPLWPMNVTNAHTLAYDTEICGDFRVPVARLACLRTPTLVLNSDHTSEWLRAAARATAAALPAGSGRELPGSWHRIDFDVLGRVLVEFALEGAETAVQWT